MLRMLFIAFFVLAGLGSAHAALLGGSAVIGPGQLTGAGTIELQDVAPEDGATAEADW
jgi:hypothetical protein